MLDLILYSTSHCHLCEQAEAMLTPYVDAGVCRVEVVDIMDSSAWLNAFGERIPVLGIRNGDADLGWPFSVRELDTWLGTQWQRT